MRAMLATDTRMFRLDREAQSRAKPRTHGTGTEGRCMLQEKQQLIGTSGGPGGCPPFRHERPGGASAMMGNAWGGQKKMPGTGPRKAVTSARARRHENAGYSERRLRTGDKHWQPSSCGYSGHRYPQRCLNKY